MKRDKLKQMLLLTCAAVVAVTSTKIYFACSADDDWEGTPEYLMTHAPMQTRATTDATGGDDGDLGPTLLVHQGSMTSAKQYIDGYTGPELVVNFSWQEGFPGTLNFNANTTFSNVDTLVYKKLKATVTSQNCPAAGLYPESSLTLTAEVSVTGYKYFYDYYGHVVKIDYISRNDLTFTVDIKSSTEWVFPEDENSVTTESTKEDNELLNGKSDESEES